MDLKGILSIAGQPGLFKLVSQMKGGLVVESLRDGRRMPAYTSQRILALEDISMYTDAEEVSLSKVYDTIIDKTGGKAAIDPKKASADELKAYLEEVLPNYDRDRVYASDIKKLFAWYNELAEKGLAVKEQEAEEEAADTSEDAKPKKETKKAATKPKVKETAAPKAAAPKVKPTTAVRKSGKG